MFKFITPLGRLLIAATVFLVGLLITIAAFSGLEDKEDKLSVIEVENSEALPQDIFVEEMNWEILTFTTTTCNGESVDFYVAGEGKNAEKNCFAVSHSRI